MGTRGCGEFLAEDSRYELAMLGFLGLDGPNKPTYD